VTSATRDEGNFRIADKSGLDESSYGKLRLSTLRELASFPTTSELVGTDVLPYPIEIDLIAGRLAVMQPPEKRS
jgi:hypothetical protein